ncbi:MAG: methyltransferase domain-containing protein [Acidobacteria bacterium]|nr:methyltransferase domain-containing protein [Acidobacteriota bacterium]
MNPQDILKSAQSFMECRILLTAAETNLFSLLKENPLTAEDIAAKTGSNLRALTMVLDALTAMELLVKQDGNYRCTESTAQLLSDNSPTSVLPMVLHMASLWHRWSCLTDMVKNIDGAKKEFEFFRKPEEMRAFIGAMHVVSGPLARKTAAIAKAESSKALLDIGGGSGSYTIAFLKAVPEMKATIFDLPDVIEMARERLREEGLLDRTALVPGDFHEQELPAGADLALISAIIHSNSPEQNLDLYKKAFRALNPGGRILVRDHVMEPGHVYPRGGAIFAINMLVGTDGGGTYTYEEIENDLTAAGFINVRLIQKGEQMDGLVEGFKP